MNCAERTELRGIKYIGFAETTGYGNAAHALFSTLQKTKIPVSYCGIQPGNTEQGGQIVHEINVGSYHSVIVHTVPEYFPYWLQKEKQRNPQVRVWGYTTWETDNIPGHWKDILNTMDGIFVPCHWNKKVFQQCGVSAPIEVLPHISQYHGTAPVSNIANAQLEDILKSARGKCILYNIGVWSERKAPELLIQAFCEEFTAADNICLILKTGNADWSSYKRNWRTLFRKSVGTAARAMTSSLKRYKNNAAIFHITDTLSEEDIQHLHLQGSCFVSLARGEGWGMGAYEATWFNKPVIITGYGGVMDYLSSANSFLVNYTLSPVQTAFGNNSYSSSQSWALADIQHARRLMRLVYEQPALASSKGLSAGKQVQIQFNNTTIINHLLTVLHDQNT
ncbi:Glycosyl transferases group 1 [Filimonas lacunae]|uniref:Glycosyl transferases group 1 n=1 Tax=Filimonas lacunae TaxID=477680 RepID=A0A173MIQ3_9BACT|nr:glycosyltransferase [Filimonas lacunae]BAV07522.1 glycosyl transferase family 1 protein-like [Filimonas lacunae]SIT30091.1 Glycosyl transferases group 1 [Filimonas lacunae]